MIDKITKAPRLFIEDDLSVGAAVSLPQDQTHYLVNVMRKGAGDQVRVFNGRDGEFIGTLNPQSKKSVSIEIVEKLKDQPHASRLIHLYFAPIKKDRMAFMIEKAVELGVTDFHPVQTDYTQHKNINENKAQKQIVEALEQCERMILPTLHSHQKLNEVKFSTPIFAAIERLDAPLFQSQDTDDIGMIIGPEGGFSDDEISYLRANDNVTAVSLGGAVLRAETAALFMLSRIE